MKNLELVNSQSGIGTIGADSLPEAVERFAAMLPIPRELISTLETTYGEFKPITVIDGATREIVDTNLADIKKHQKWAKAELLKFTGPIGTLEERVRSAFRKLSGYLSASEAECKQSILTYEREVAKRLEEQRAAAQKAEDDAAEAQRKALEDKALEAELEGRVVDAGFLAAKAESTTPVRVAVPVLNHGGKATTRTVRKWERTGEPIDPAYLILDEARIARECKAGMPAPAGIRYWDDIDISARASK